MCISILVMVMRRGNGKFKGLFVELTKSTDSAVRLISAITRTDRRKLQSLPPSDILQHLSVLLHDIKNEKQLLHVVNNKEFLSRYLSQNQLHKLNNKNIKQQRLLPEFPLAKKLYEMVKIRASIRGDNAMQQAMLRISPTFDGGQFLSSTGSSNDNAKGKNLGKAPF